MKQRAFAWAWAVVAPASLALLACQPGPVGPPAAPPPGAPSGPATTDEPRAPLKQGGTFILPATQVTPNLDYWEISGSAQSVGLQPALEQLLAYDFRERQDWRAGFTIMPRLAERWEIATPTTYVFHIRKGAKWHDGIEFTAEDVKWAYEMFLNPANGYRARGNLALVESMEVPDPYTLKTTTKAPSPTFLEGLADRNSVIQSRHVAARGEKFAEVLVGTGPYKLESFDRQKGINFVRNPDYWAKGRPGADQVRIIWPLDPVARLAAFVSKQGDILKLNSKPEFEVVQRQVPDLTPYVFLRDIESPFFLKLDQPPFNDVRVRKALHLAIDRQEMVQTMTFGLGIANPPLMNGGRTGWVIPQEELKTLPGYRQPKDQDIAEARRLLAEAGYPNGFRATVRIRAASSITGKQAEVAAEHARRVGIELKLEVLEDGVFAKAAKDGNYEIIVDTGSQFQPEQAWQNLLHSNGALNNMPIRDAELDALVERQATELDVEKRKQLFLQIQRHLLDKMYIIPGVSDVAYTVWHPYVHGWIDNFAGQAANPDWSQLWLDVEKLPSGR